MEKITLVEAIDLKNNGRKKEAENALMELTKTDEYADKAWYHLGLMADEDDNYELAVNRYDAALEKNPEYFKAANNLGSTLLAMEKYSEAFHSLEYAHRLSPGELYPLYNMARAAFGLRDFKTALEFCKKTREMMAFTILSTEQQQQLNLMTGNCYLNLNQVSEAVKEYEAVSRIKSPDQVVALNQLGYIALEINKDLEAAERYIDLALELDAGFKPCVQNKGLILKARKKYTEARPYLQQVIDLDPSGFEGYYNLACLYCAMALEHEARTAMEKAIRLYPEIKAYMRQDQDFAVYAQKDWFKAMIA